MRMSLKLCVIASGSKGNCCYVSDGNTDAIVDMGISATRTCKSLSLIGAAPSNVAVLVTHSHIDHIAGLDCFCKRFAPSVYAQRSTASEIVHRFHRPLAVNVFQPPAAFEVGTLSVRPFALSHDVPCVGYKIASNDKSIAIATDSGILTNECLSQLAYCDTVVLECNHDIDTLKANRRYTPELKRRILSPFGHLSNADCSEACRYLATTGVKHIVLAHLSEENNSPSMAFSAVRSALDSNGFYDVKVTVALQDDMTEMYLVQ